MMFSKDSRLYIKSRLLAKTAIIEASSALAASGCFRRKRGRGLIFTLHHVRPKRPAAFDPNAHLEVTPDFLDLAIKTLLNAGYDFIGPDALADAMADRSRKPFAIFTLDDGYRDNVAHALPVFAKHAVPFTVFACTGFIQRTHTMWWETAFELLQTHKALDYDFGNGREHVQLATNADKDDVYRRIANRIMNFDERAAIEHLNETARNYGLDPTKAVEESILDETELKALSLHPLATIGAHSVSHRAMARLSSDELRSEIVDSRAYLTDLLGRAPTIFAFPYGHHAQAGQREFELVGELGFQAAVTTRQAVLTENNLRQPTQLPRVNIDGLQQKSRYIKALASGIPFPSDG